MQIHVFLKYVFLGILFLLLSILPLIESQDYMFPTEVPKTIFFLLCLIPFSVISIVLLTDSEDKFRITKVDLLLALIVSYFIINRKMQGQTNVSIRQNPSG
ncbi:MAG: hypothetical protein EA341_03315 [Mongoliibacter sp.]|nr:MAG: hypothetical protein EA341_03315 [Mongoliibacter sp.]